MEGMKALLLWTLMAVAGTTVARAALEDEIKEADIQWAAAAKAGDAAKLDRLLSTDLIYTHATGIIDDKAAYIEKLKSKRQKYDGIIHSNVRVKVFGGDMAILTARMRMHGTNQSGAFDDQLLLIHVWVKVNGSWQLAAHQTTKLQ
jgi:ketosteroid isomerase-like protein